MFDSKVNLRMGIVPRNYSAFVVAGTLATLMLAVSPSFGQVLVDGEPDPTYDGNAMQLWLRGDSGVTESGGGVSSWADRSTHGNDVAQDSVINRPIVGTFAGETILRDVIRFANPGGATDQFLDTGTNLESTWAESFTVFSLIAPNDGVPPVDNVWFGINDNGFTTRWWGNVAPALANPNGTIDMIYRPNAGQVSTLFQPTSPFPDGPQTDLKLLTIRVDDPANTLELFVDGSPYFSGTLNVDNTQFSAPNSTVYIGAGSQESGPWIAFDGDIAEMIIYKGALSNSDLAAVDNYILSFSEAGAQTIFEWTTDNGLGNWNSRSNWTFSGGPNGADHTAILSGMTTQTTTVVTNSAVTVNSLQFDNSNSYIVAGGGSVNMEANSTGGVPSMQVVQGTHEFQARVNLIDSTTVDVASDATIEFNNRLNLGGNTLTKINSGTLAINNVVTTDGGTILAFGGTIEGWGTIGGSLDNQSATISPGGSAASPSAVPEPNAMVLVALGILAMIWKLPRLQLSWNHQAQSVTQPKDLKFC